MRRATSVSVAVLLISWFCGSALAAPIDIVEEQINPSTLEFTVINNTDPLLELNVEAFVVGNDDAGYTFTDNDWEVASDAYWNAGEFGCDLIWCYGDYEEIEWLVDDGTNLLDPYERAFYFAVGGEGTPIAPGTSLGDFFGSSEFPASPFLALLSDGSVVTGETIPEPSVALLVGAGLIGLAGLRRKHRRS